jgi:hypothetical protein
MAQAERTLSKRNGEIIRADNLTLGERIDAIRLATHEAHTARIAEARRAFETRIVDLVQARIDHAVDGILGEWRATAIFGVR